MQIEAVGSVSDFWIDDRVVVTGKDVDALVRDVVRVVDVPAAGPFVGFFEEWLEVGGRSFHAGTGRPETGAEIAQETIYGGALGQKKKPPRNDAPPFYHLRPGNPRLPRPKSARRDTPQPTF